MNRIVKTGFLFILCAFLLVGCSFDMSGVNNVVDAVKPVALSGSLKSDVIVPEDGIPVKKLDFENISFTNTESAKIYIVPSDETSVEITYPSDMENHGFRAFISEGEIEISAPKQTNFSAEKFEVTVYANIEEIEIYRNNITHFYCEQLEPYIFMLTAKSALNYVGFIKDYFEKDIMAEDGLFILPLGFKLPFNPVDFLSGSIAKYASSKEAQEFISSIIKATKDLENEGVQDSIVLGFDVFLESVKKATNSDILAALTSEDKANALIAKTKRVKFARDASEIVGMSDEEFRSIWKYTHADVLDWCKENIPNFKQGTVYNAAKRSISSDINCVYERKLDVRNPKSQSKKFYTEKALEQLKAYYLEVTA